MTSPLSGIPIPRRRQLAATLALFAVLFVTVGAVALTASATTVLVFGGFALAVALLLTLIAWGVARSIRIDRADARLDAVLEAAVAEQFGSLCSCGHEHDPRITHVTDVDPPEADGSGTKPCGHTGADCEMDCSSCVLAAMRPSPHSSRTERLAAQ